MQHSSQTVARGIIVLVFYLYTFWNVFKTHPGNKFVRTAIIALIVFAALIVLTQFPSTPGWLLGYLGLLLLSLCILSLCFLLTRGYRTIRHRHGDGIDTRSSTDPVGSNPRTPLK
jgi:hypothetical protein